MAKADRMRTFWRVGGTGVFIPLILLLTAALSWGDIKLMVTQSYVDGTLGASICDQGSCSGSNVVLPKSCEPINLSWDASLGKWLLVGFDGTSNVWSEQLSYNASSGVSASAPVGTPPQSCSDVSSTFGPSNTVFSSAPPTCTSFSYACSGGCQSNGTCSAFVTGAYPSGCTGGTPGSTTTCTYVPPSPPACTYTYTGCTTACQQGGYCPIAVLSALPSGCIGTPMTAKACTYVAPVNGTCGSANGTTVTAAPTTNLCSSGTATSVSGSGPWSWSCQGSNGGTNASCTAYLYTTNPVNGACGSANGTSVSTAPTSNLCNAGTPTSVTGSGPWSWTCQGSNGGTNTSCSANYSGGTQPPTTNGCPAASSTLVYIPGPYNANSPSTSLGMSTSTAETIGAYGEKHYFFCLSTAPTTSIQISMATEDWATNQDILVSNVSQPSCTQDPKASVRNVTPNQPPWYNILAGSTESVLMLPPANQGLVYYVTVCSQSSVTGKYGLYWVSK